MQRISLMGIHIHSVTETEVVERIISDLGRGLGGWVVTPNLEHLRILSHQPNLLGIADDASLMIADGMPLVWASRLQGTPLPMRVAGSSLILSLTAAAAKAGCSVFFLGGSPGAAEAASTIFLRDHPGLKVAGTFCPPMGFEKDPAQLDCIKALVLSARPDIVYSCLGFPKQEWLIRELRDFLPTTWFLGLGGSLSMVSGELPRAPGWMQKMGLEWTYRLLLEPRRLFKRYIVHGLPFALRLFGHSLWHRLSRKRDHTVVDDNMLTESSAIVAETETVATVPDQMRGEMLNDETRRKVLRRYQALGAGAWRRWRHDWRFHFKKLSWVMLLTGANLIKRLIDVAGSLIVLILFSPILMLIALLIKLESPGPVFFKQIRVGKWGRTFELYKFRSMHRDAEFKKEGLLAKNEMAGGVIFKIKSDPRITRFGRLLRRYSIDELPQLFNVFRGEMSLVGPRPPVPSEVTMYSLAERQRLDVIPGITCIWQVSGRSEIPFEKQVELDIAYIESQSLWLDIKLLLKTLPSVLIGRGAY